ncbi:NF-X1-type zinc finger protein NFXL2 isoform X1 [Typha latifolia]|uniref:NF-X1-type zinc finger protein NFXL2 isoform X1 n=1 Tax=Typha latifolia TaxID=4733 RepID=UPI003C2FF0C9
MQSAQRSPENVQPRHLPPMPTTITTTAQHHPGNPNPTASGLISSESDATTTSSGDDFCSENPSGRRSALEDSILSAYLEISGGNHRNSPDLSKIRSFLSSSSRRSTSCLICLDPIRHSDPIWSCSSSCHAIFHLPCIHLWSTQSLQKPNSSFPPTDWPCPKCRLSYPKSLIPRSYLCFCGKVEDPVPDPWILPHSCGEVCGRSLSGNCGHSCLLLCHPGPCPPCPKLVSSRCFCGKLEDLRRCAHSRFSCGRVCRKLLPCGAHRCPEICHDSDCPPCSMKGKHRCACGREEEERVCAERGFQCRRDCEGVLGCGKHKCERGCHSGPCGDCPLQGRRTCPCGKKEYKGVGCDAEVPNCGSTCEKLLTCGRHQCPERCHRGPCAETCRTVIVKSCRCGGLRKEVPCYQDLACERKCQRVRDCGRHACKRRCCDGDCPPCPEICDRKLRCNNHKCPSPCHRGACSPCPLMVSISCCCGHTHFEVPCGTEKNQKPPKCSKSCCEARLCIHKSESRPHKCHYGACPPCRMICGEELSCGHKCKERCHGPVPPPKPEFTLKPKKKKIGRSIECSPGSPCPPCQEVVLVVCFGQHIGEERQMLCSNMRQFPCQNLCGNLLSCGNHYCTKPCHVLKSQLLDQHGRHDSRSPPSESCEECCLPCEKVRVPSCSHPCPLPCHLDNCPPCKVLIKRSCHCGSLVHAFECIYYNSLSNEEQQKVRSCGGPCHRKLPNCPHLCSEICHPGQCPLIDRCRKKVIVRCACNTLRKDWLCQDVFKAYRDAGLDPKDILKSQFGVGLLPCGLDCTRKVKIVDSELLLRKSNEIKKPAVDVANVPKRRKRRAQLQETRQLSKFQDIKRTMLRFLLLILLLIAVVAVIYLGYKGIFRLSDWMDEIEDKRMRKRSRF